MSTRVAPSASSRSTSACWSPSAGGARSRCSRFLPRFGRHRRPAPGDLRPAVRRPDRGLLVLVPDQRPAERLAPEVPDLLGAVAGERAEKPQSARNALPGLDDAELVALRVGQHDVALLRPLADVDVPAAELERPGHRPPLVLEGGARQVEVHPVRDVLRLRRRREPDREPGVVGGQQRDPAAGVVGRSPSRAARPRTARAGGVVRVDGERDEGSTSWGSGFGAGRGRRNAVSGLASVHDEPAVPAAAVAVPVADRPDPPARAGPLPGARSGRPDRAAAHGAAAGLTVRRAAFADRRDAGRALGARLAGTLPGDVARARPAARRCGGRRRGGRRARRPARRPAGAQAGPARAAGARHGRGGRDRRRGRDGALRGGPRGRRCRRRHLRRGARPRAGRAAPPRGRLPGGPSAGGRRRPHRRPRRRRPGDRRDRARRRCGCWPDGARRAPSWRCRWGRPTRSASSAPSPTRWSACSRRRPCARSAAPTATSPRPPTTRSAALSGTPLRNCDASLLQGVLSCSSHPGLEWATEPLCESIHKVRDEGVETACQGRPTGAPTSIVVGAGPAGSAAAYQLRQAGREVLVLEKTEFPREKVCGDGLTPRGVKPLQDWASTPRPQAGWVRHKGLRVHGGGVVSSWTGRGCSHWPDYGLVLRRSDFDARLAAHARGRRRPAAHRRHRHRAAARRRRPGRRRARARPGRTRSRRSCRAPLVVAADGVSGRLAKSLGLAKREDRPIGVAVRRYFRSPPRRRRLPGLPSSCAADGPVAATRCPATAGSSAWATAPRTSGSACSHPSRRPATDYRAVLRAWLDTFPAEEGLRRGGRGHARCAAPACRWASTACRTTPAACCWPATPPAWSTRSTARASLRMESGGLAAETAAEALARPAGPARERRCAATPTG